MKSFGRSLKKVMLDKIFVWIVYASSIRNRIGSSLINSTVSSRLLEWCDMVDLPLVIELEGIPELIVERIWDVVLVS